MKKCRICNKIKPGTSFFKNGVRRKDGTSGTRNECKACSKKIHDRYVEKNRETLNKYMKSRYTPKEQKRIRAYALMKMYGLSTDEYKNMLVAQKNRCAICRCRKNQKERFFDVDHDHLTGKIRGLCCIRCNRGMGLLKDSPKILRAAADYIEKNKN